MEAIAISCIKCCQKNFIHRDNSHQLLGFDFMVDNNLNVWLIEINCSPSLDKSNTTLGKLIEELSEDYIKVIVD